MKRLLLLSIFLLSGIWSTVEAGTVYDLTDQLSPAATPGLAHQSLRVNMTPLKRLTILADNRTTTSSMMMYQKATWPAGGFDSLLDIDGVAGAGSIDAAIPSMIHNLGESLFVDMVDDAGPQSHSRYHNFTFQSRDTVWPTTMSSPRIAGSWYVPGDSMIVIVDKELGATDSTTMQLSNGAVGSSTVWTEIQNDARVANAGLVIPVYDGVGQSRYILKYNLNTNDIIIYDRLNGATTVSTNILSGAGDLQTPGYWAGWIVHIKADTFAVIYQKGLTGTKGLFERPFYITWSGTTPTGVDFNATEQTIIASGSFPDSLRSCPTGSAIYDRADTVHFYFRMGSTRDVEGVYRVSSFDGGRTLQSAVKEIDTSECSDKKFWSLQAPPKIVSGSGTQHLGLAWSDSVTTSGSAHLFAWTDTLYNPATVASGPPTALNSKTGPSVLNSIGGPSAINRKE